MLAMASCAREQQQAARECAGRRGSGTVSRFAQSRVRTVRTPRAPNRINARVNALVCDQGRQTGYTHQPNGLQA